MKQLWMNRVMASREELRSEVVSSLEWVGRASTMEPSTEAGLRGSVVIVKVVVREIETGLIWRNVFGWYRMMWM